MKHLQSKTRTVRNVNACMFTLSKHFIVPGKSLINIMEMEVYLHERNSIILFVVFYFQ